MTQEKCERAVKALKHHGFKASYVHRRPDEHMVWMDVPTKDGDWCLFRLHDEEIEHWQKHCK